MGIKSFLAKPFAKFIQKKVNDESRSAVINQEKFCIIYYQTRLNPVWKKIISLMQ